MTAPGKKSLAGLPTRNISTPSKLPSQSGPLSQVKKQPLSQVQNIQTPPRVRPLSNSKTVGRTPKSRPSLAGAFGETVSQPAKAAPVTPSPNRETGLTDMSPTSTRKVSSSSKALREQIAKAKAARKSNVAAESIEPAEPAESPRGASSSSSALREQIARAKEAARRANASKKGGVSSAPKQIPAVTENAFAVVPDPAEIAEFDFGLDDPFNQGPKGSKSLLRKRIDAARVDGRLNIAAMGLKEFPDDVLTMYKYDPDDNSIAWGEVVDLTTLIAADNEIKSLPDGLCPDVDIDSFGDSDEDGAQFGALQTIDLHGNMLQTIPMGFRRLTQLTKLNLSRNRLENGVFDILSHISSLRELRCSENAFHGGLPQSLGRLTNLEVLDLQSNQLTSLPDEIQELVRLRTLNISDNQISTIHSGFFASVPIVELLASKNRFCGVFFTVNAAPHLQNLQLSNNGITELCQAGTISLPALKNLNISANRLSRFPDMSSWESLVTLLAGENKFTSLPDDFFSLPRLRIADFSSNDFTKLDERIALMENLENFTIVANPLRERKFLTMDTEAMKRDLLSRLEPGLLESKGQSEFADDSAVDTPTGGFTMKPAGTLDLSAKGLYELEEDNLIAFAEENPIRQLKLNQNCFTFVPPVLAHLVHLTVLDLSYNSVMHPFAEEVSFPRLQELRLVNNKLRSFSEIMSYLFAPGLQRLDVTNNRISGQLPRLRDAFPALSMLLAADNAITEAPAETIEGLKVVNLSNNEIARLDPRIGLYAGTLTGFEVEGNTFRVPNYKVIQKGTEAVLTWLRDRIPSDEF
jgi:Leucine-rich repeat (LRR) protein